MKKQGVNPYLTSWEYIPDGEPYVFDGRMYVYGSHDKFNGYGYCMNDYVCWSAPEDDLNDWRYEGVICKKTDDPFCGHNCYRSESFGVTRIFPGIFPAARASLGI